jgi:cytochrome c biogenesis protein CcdA/copper chaperone CopZ
MTEQRFHVSDIHCGGCSTTIDGALRQLQGVEDVVPDRKTSSVLVAYDDSQVDEATIVERLGEAGFPLQQPSGEARRGWWTRYGGLTAAVVVLALAGYVGYELYPRFDLPAVEGAGLLVLAAAAGIASFFAPCSFPLLVTLLSRQVGQPDQTHGDGRPAVFASALAAGAAAFLVLLGALIALGGGAFAASVTFTSTVGITLRIVVGVALVLLGLVQLGVLSDTSFRSVERVTKRLNRSQARLRRERPVAGFAAFGFFYLLAGFG